MVRHLTLLQIDPIAAIAPSADLVAWRASDNRNVTQLLEFMVLRGEVAVAGRRGGDRAVGPGDAGLPR